MNLMFIFIWILMCLCSFKVLPQNIDKEVNNKPRLFIEGPNIDFDYLRREVTFVDYVRDRNQSDILLLVTRRGAGSTGREYTMFFTGRGIFEGINDTILYYTRGIDSEEEERAGFVKTLKRGLFPDINRTQLAENIDIVYDERAESNKSELLMNDPWGYWVFRIELEGWINGESQTESYSLSSSLRAERITDEWKLKFLLGIGYQQDDYTYEDENYLSISRNKFIEIESIKSTGENFGLGLFCNYNSSTYRNIEHEIAFYPGAEYSVYPYSESSFRRITFAYRIGYDWNEYIEETIFNKLKETIVKQRLDLNLEFKEQWGEVNMEINYFTKINELNRNRIEVRGGISINLFEGFGIQLSAGYSKIRDQYSIPKSQLSLDDLLLKRRELLTQYSYWGSIGFSYTFGSIYNNIVNPRF